MQYALFEFFTVEPKTDDTKVCNRCNKEKDKSDFYASKNNTDGLHNNCKECAKELQKWRYWEIKKREHTRPEVCDCCGRPPSTSGKGTGVTTLSLDHCHITEEFRGWLCQDCNVAIGKLGDNLEGLMKAVEYLKRAESNEED
jgi:protein-arginine kinase activator protein McsA